MNNLCFSTYKGENVTIFFFRCNHSDFSHLPIVYKTFFIKSLGIPNRCSEGPLYIWQNMNSTQEDIMIIKTNSGSKIPPVTKAINYINIKKLPSTTWDLTKNFYYKERKIEWKRGMQILQSLENKRITFWFYYLKNPKEESSLESNKGV